MAYVQKPQTKISGADISVDTTAPPSGFTRFLSTAADTLQEKLTSRKTQVEKDTEKMNYYATLRQSGYSAEEATSRVNKGFKTAWLERVMGKNQQFQKPTTDPYAATAAKSAAEVEEKQSAAQLNRSKAGYYDVGGPKRTVIDKMTPNQLQQRLKYLNESAENPDSPEVKQEVEYLNKRIQGILGFSKSGASETVKMKAPDGTVRDIPKEKVDYFKQKGATLVQ